MMQATAKKLPVTTDLWEDFIARNPAPDWVQTLRSKGHGTFAHMGLPIPKIERYKYTNIAQALSTINFAFATADVTAKGNTQFLSSIADNINNLPDWVKEMAQATPPGEAQYKDMALWHGVNAYLRDGFYLDVPAKTTEQTPLEITIDGHDNGTFIPRTFLRIGAGAEFTIIERHTGEGTYWNNRITQIHVEKGARLRHYRIQDNSDKAVYTQNTHVVMDRDATYEAFVLTTGAALSRSQIHVELKGENGEVRLGGVNLLKGTQLGDTTITIDHQAPHCHSNQNYKSILDEKSHGVFQGKVHVFQIAQKTDGYQLANALLLSPTAQMDTKPELEIYADDVRCSHGATTGQIDTAPLFYLRTRGLSEAEARLLLMQAFLGPALDDIRDDNAREMFSDLAFQWLQKRLAK
jgi:Fe-S cluster assembly protein SufD